MKLTAFSFLFKLSENKQFAKRWWTACIIEWFVHMAGLSSGQHSAGAFVPHCKVTPYGSL